MCDREYPVAVDQFSPLVPHPLRYHLLCLPNFVKGLLIVLFDHLQTHREASKSISNDSIKEEQSSLTEKSRDPRVDSGGYVSRKSI